MPNIYLKHERHGNKVAFSEQEAQYDVGNGWVRYTVPEIAEPVAPVPVPVEPVDETLPAFLQPENSLIQKRRGRPPKNVDPMT